MKRKSILTMVFIFVVSMMLALVSCSITVPTSEPSAESESKTQVVVGGAEMLADIFAANEYANVIETQKDAFVYVYNPADEGLYTMYYLYAGEGETLSYNLDIGVENSEDEILSVTNIRGREGYTVSGDAKMFSYYPEADDCAYALSLMPSLDTSAVLEGDIYKDDAESPFIRFVLTKTGKKTEPVARYECTAYEGSNFLMHVEYTLTNPDGTIALESTIAFAYGVSEYLGEYYQPSHAAIEEISNVSESAVPFEVRFANNKEILESYVFTLDSDVIVSLPITIDGKSYSFYKNVSCTKNIEDLMEYVYYYGEDVYVYAGITGPEFSFDFLLSEDDIVEMETYIDEFIAYAKEDNMFGAESVREYVEDKMEYFIHQYHMGQIRYYVNTTSAKNKEAFNFAAETYSDIYVKYIDMYKTVYELTDNEYSKWLFEGWSEEDLAVLYADNEAITECENIQEQLEQELAELRTGSYTSYDIEVIYEKVVNNYQRLAQLHGYDNAYDYKSRESYNRNYTEEERAAMFQFTKDYIVSYTDDAYGKYSSATSGLTQKDVDDYNNFLTGNVKSLNNKYISGYINSYNNSLNAKMVAMYEKEAVKFAGLDSSMGTAYAQYSYYYEEAFTFFGKPYHDVLSIIHEMGHYISLGTYRLNDMGYDLAEIHSQGNEWMFRNYIQDKISKKTYEILESIALYNSMLTVLNGVIVDEFEYRVYKSETPLVAGEFRAVMEGVLLDLGMSVYDMKEYYDDYAQIVTITSPIYYINYATSELAAMGFYLLCEDENYGYEYAQEVYRKLQEDVDLSMRFSEILADIGLPSPFEEETYIRIGEVFFPEEEE